MRILRIIPSMNPKQGGPCQGIRNAAPELSKLGVQTEVVCFNEVDSGFIENDTFTIHPLGKPSHVWGYNKKFIPWMLDNFERFDIIIIHGLWLYQSQATIKAMFTYKKTNNTLPKVYVMPHGMLDPYFQKAKNRKLKALRNSIYWKLFENNVINKADGVLFTCEEELLLARTTFPNYNPQKEINVGYGIQSPPVFNEAMKQEFKNNLPNWNGLPFLLFLSRIHPKKGVNMLINAYNKLEQELDDIPQLIIAGPNDHNYGVQMKKLAENSSNILFAGMLSGNAKWGAFYNSEVFVLPSHQENFGIAVVEALACNKPVLISNKVNIWREIEKGNGGIVTNDTQKDTYHLLRQWITLTKEQKEVMSLKAKKVYESNFTIEIAAKQFLNGIKS